MSVLQKQECPICGQDRCPVAMANPVRVAVNGKSTYYVQSGTPDMTVSTAEGTEYLTFRWADLSPGFDDLEYVKQVAQSEWHALLEYEHGRETLEARAEVEISW